MPESWTLNSIKAVQNTINLDVIMQIVLNSSLFLVSSTWSSQCTQNHLHMGPDYLLVTLMGLITLGYLCPLGWMQHFIMFPPKQIQLQSIGKQVDFTEALGDRMKTKFTTFHIKIPIRPHSTAKAFSLPQASPLIFPPLYPSPLFSSCSLC